MICGSGLITLVTDVNPAPPSKHKETVKGLFTGINTRNRRKPEKLLWCDAVYKRTQNKILQWTNQINIYVNIIYAYKCHN